MYRIPQKRKRKPMGVKVSTVIRSPGHLAWIRKRECAVASGACSGVTEAAHVRTGTDGGTSLKPGDNWTLPLCSHHHRWQHNNGEASFEVFFKINMKAIAQAMWQASPHRRKWEDKQKERAA
jgi:hypothetical protein